MIRYRHTLALLLSALVACEAPKTPSEHFLDQKESTELTLNGQFRIILSDFDFKSDAHGTCKVVNTKTGTESAWFVRDWFNGTLYYAVNTDAATLVIDPEGAITQDKDTIRHFHDRIVEKRFSTP